MLENLRFHPQEEANDDEYAKTLASYGDVYVNDAFGTAHRAHASTVGVTKYLPAYAGLLMEREIETLSKLLENAEHPFAAIIGGAKVSGKMAVLNHLMTLSTCSSSVAAWPTRSLSHRATAWARACSRGIVVDDAQADPRARPGQERRPAAADGRCRRQGGHARRRAQDRQGQQDPQLLVGGRCRTADDRRRSRPRLRPARTVFWNGPLGVFEVPTFGDGTRAMGASSPAWPRRA